MKNNILYQCFYWFFHLQNNNKIVNYSRSCTPILSILPDAIVIQQYIFNITGNIFFYGSKGGKKLQPQMREERMGLGGMFFKSLGVLMLAMLSIYLHS